MRSKTAQIKLNELTYIKSAFYQSNTFCTDFKKKKKTFVVKIEKVIVPLSFSGPKAYLNTAKLANVFIFLIGYMCKYCLTSSLIQHDENWLI